MLPIALFLLFILIFQTANPIFLEKTLFLQQAFEVFIKEFPTFSIPRTAFTIFGYIILSGIFFNRKKFNAKFFENPGIPKYVTDNEYLIVFKGDSLDKKMQFEYSYSIFSIPD